MLRWDGLLLAAAMVAAPCAARADDGATVPAGESAPDLAESRPASSYRTALADLWQASTLQLSIGATYAQGDYDPSDSTEVYAVPVSLRWGVGHWSMRLTVPWVHLSGPTGLLDGSNPGENAGNGFGFAGQSAHAGGLFFGGAMPGPDIVASGSATNSSYADRTSGASLSSSGLGDVTLSLGRNLDLGSIASLDLLARVKLPTGAASRGLGTGKTDVTLGADITHSFDRLSLTIGGRHRFVGVPDYLPLRDIWSIDGEISYRLGQRVLVGIDNEWRQSLVAGYGPVDEMTGWTSLPLGHSLRAQVFGGRSVFTRGASLIAGVSLAWRIKG